VTPVWFDFDGQHVVINSAKGRVKDRNMRRDRAWRCCSSTGESLSPPASAGAGVEITESGADQHIDKLAKKYLDKDKYSVTARSAQSYKSPALRPGWRTDTYLVQVLLASLSMCDPRPLGDLHHPPGTCRWR